MLHCFSPVIFIYPQDIWTSLCLCFFGSGWKTRSICILQQNKCAWNGSNKVTQSICICLTLFVDLQQKRALRYMRIVAWTVKRSVSVRIFWLRKEKTTAAQSLNFISFQFIFHHPPDSSWEEHKLLVASTSIVCDLLWAFVYIYVRMLLMILNPDILMWSVYISVRSNTHWIGDKSLSSQSTWKWNEKFISDRYGDSNVLKHKSAKRTQLCHRFSMFDFAWACLEWKRRERSDECDAKQKQKRKKICINKNMLSSCSSLVCQHFVFGVYVWKWVCCVLVYMCML